MTMTRSSPSTQIPPASPRADRIAKQVSRRSFCMLATTSSSNHPHVAGVLYATHGSVLYVSTRRTSRKARNVARNPRVFVCVPVRRLPVGPPSSVQFAGTAEVLDMDHPDVADLVAHGALTSITSHGELDLADGCFLRITPADSLLTYGLGLPLRRLMRDPLHAEGRVELAPGPTRPGR